MPSETNFMPNPASAYEQPTVFHSDSTMAGSGSPEGVVPGWPGAMYVDTDSSDLWKKVSGLGTNTGWEEHTGGGGAGDPQVFSSVSSDPTDDPGVSSAIHFRRDDGSVWFWNDTAGAWVKVIG